MAEEIKQDLGFDASQALKTLAQLDGSLAQFEKRLQSTSGALQGFNATGAQVGNLNRAFQSNVPQMVTQVQRLHTSLTLLSRIVFTQFIVRALSQLRNAFRASAGEAVAFQKQLALISTIDDSGQSLAQLGDTVRGISEQFNIPLLETAAGLYQTISNQIGDAAESTEFLAKASEFARATNASTANSVDLLSAALKSYNLDVSETAKVSATFFKAIDLGRLEANELANSLGRILSVSGELGISLEEVGGSLAAISVKGSGTAETITQLRNIQTALLKPTEAMTKALRDQGFASAESAIKTLSLPGVLRQLDQSTQGSAEALARLFPNVRGLSGATSLLSGDLKSLASNIDEMTKAAENFTAEKFLQATNTDAEKLTKEINKLKNAFTIDLGFAIVKSGVQLSEWVGGSANVVAAAKAAGPVILGVAGAFGVARLQIAAARAELGLLSKGLGAISLAPLAIGAGASLGQFIDSNREKARNEVLRALEAQHTAELRLIEAKLKKQRDLEDKADADQIKATRQLTLSLNRLYLQDFDNQRSASDALVANTEANLSKILGARTSFVDELARAAARSGDIARASSERIVGLRDVQGDRKFDERISNLADAEKAQAIARRAQEIAGQASRQLAKGGLLGDPDKIATALDQFGKSQSLLEQSSDIAKRTGNRELEARAMQLLKNLTADQISAEERLTKIQSDRQKKIDEERTRQQKITDEIRAQAKIINDNTGLFNAKGEQFNAADQAKRAAAQQAALRKVASLRLSQTDLSAADAFGVADFIAKSESLLSRDPLKLSIDVQSATAQIQQALTESFSTFKVKSGVDVAGLEKVLGRTLTTPDQISQALDTVAKKAAETRLAIDNALTAAPKQNALRAEIAELLAQIETGSAQGILGTKPRGDALRGQFAAIEADLKALAQSSTITQAQLDAVVAKRNTFGRAALDGGGFLGQVIQNGRLAFADEIVGIDDIITRLQQLSKLPQADVGGLESQLQKMEAVLQSNPSEQFEGASTAIGNAAAASERVASSWERAAAAAARVGLGSAPQGFATAVAASGSANTTTKQPFAPQIQALNTAPVVNKNASTSSVDNSIGNVTINVTGGNTNQQTAKALATEMQRLQRRGVVKPVGITGGTQFSGKSQFKQ